MHNTKSRILSPQHRNGGKHKGESKPEGGALVKIRRGFIGARGEHGRAKLMETKEQEKKEEKEPKTREYPIPPKGYVFGVKPWLKRKEVWWEFGLSPRSLRRLEHRGLVHPRVLIGHYHYDRTEIDTGIRDAVLLEPHGKEGL
jgi:hypothetical protein